jgi:MerR family copper efflux transcriptional regulator
VGAAVLIGELAQSTGSSARSLRHYDRRGLLPVARTGNGYRDFPPEAVPRVRAIRALLACGLTVADIEALLPCTDSDGVVRPCGEVLARLHRQLEELDRQATEVERARQAVRLQLSALSSSES